MAVSSPLMLLAAALGGAVAGNFLAACIRDLPRQQPVRWPGRTASRFLIVELLTAALWAVAFWYFGPGWLFASRVILGGALIVLFAIDLEHRLLPNAITLPGIAIGFLLSFVTDPGWQSSLTGIAVGGLPLAIGEIYQRVRGREGVGMGDVKMLAMIGAFLGWPGALMTLMIGSIAGSIAGLIVVVRRRGDMQHALPFGTFLAAAAALWEVLARVLDHATR